MDKVFELLKYITEFGYEAYIVGGFVRDKLLNIESFDIDICTNAKSNELKIILPELKEKDLFCSYMKLDNYNIEITTYRKEENYNGRRPLGVKYANKLIDDLQRRDFTINTICMDSNGKIIDLLDGLTDLNNKIVKCVGISDIKIKEDTLRIMRAIRFSSVLGFDLDENLINSINKYKENLKMLSSFRKRQEMDKIVESRGLDIIKKLDVEKELGIIIPDNINYTDNIIGVYAQCDINLDSFFNRTELKKYNLLRKYYLKELDKYDLFLLDEADVITLSNIKNEDLFSRYNKLKIHDERELDINLSKLNSEKKEKIIRAILDGKLENNSFSIANYIANIF